ncbi:MAG: MlaD family protein [Muribaculaceae bacterium]|nr:MlaD family protein [Muribaculaceae bacterium]
MKSLKKEATIGLCVIIALFILFIGINFLKGVNIFKAANYYYAVYENAAGLQDSAPVTLDGFKVGLVREINYEYNNPGHVKVELSLDRSLKLPEGSKAVIEQDILGTSTVVLYLSDSKNYHKVGDEIEGVTAKGLMENVSQNLMPGVAAIFPKIDSLLTSLNRVVGDPALMASVKRLDAITLNLEQTMRQLNATAGSLPPVMNNVGGITKNLNAMSGDLAEFSARINDMPVDSMMNNVMALSENLKTLSASLNNPDSSLGMLTHDAELYDNLNNCAASLDSLLIDVKRNPKRYISIKLL